MFILNLHCGNAVWLQPSIIFDLYIQDIVGSTEYYNSSLKLYLFRNCENYVTLWCTFSNEELVARLTNSMAKFHKIWDPWVSHFLLQNFDFILWPFAQLQRLCCYTIFDHITVCVTNYFLCDPYVIDCTVMTDILCTVNHFLGEKLWKLVKWWKIWKLV